MSSDIDFIKRDNKHVPSEQGGFALKNFGLFCASFVAGIPLGLAGFASRKAFNKSGSKAIGKKFEYSPAAECMVGNLKPLAEREFDIVVYGATGFTGGLAAQYLAKQYGNTVKWAIAGRREQALKAVRDKCLALNASMQEVPLIIVDSNDENQLQSMCSRTKVVVTTVGPFQLYGTPLVRACISTKTSCCDITGEIDWHKGLIEHYDAVAQAAGSRIVSFSGHDCVPWDLMTFILSKKLKETSPGEDAVLVEYTDDVNSSPSGGTISTIIESIHDPRPYKPEKLPFDPLFKKSDGSKSEYQLKNKSNFLPVKDSFGKWCGPFVMSAVNAEVVKRGNVLNEYGKNLAYKELRVAPSFSVLTGRYFQMGAVGPVLIMPSSIQKLLLPQPGEGPSEETMNNGFLQVTGIITGEKGTKVGGRMYFKTDPGYRDTARMLVETGLTLALSLDRSKPGVLTPGSCCAEALFERLLQTGTEFTFLSSLSS